MGDFPSISSNIKTPRVYAGLAPNAQSERFQDSRFNICPNRNSVDSYGRCAPRFGINRLTGGCHPASERVDIETAIRPSYHPHLNADGLRGQGHSSYDTWRGGAVPGRDEAFGCSGSYATQACNLKSAPRSFSSNCEKKRYNSALRKVYEKRSCGY